MIRAFVIALLRLYQRFVSPLFGPSCRYRPTCSQYAVDAVRERGVVVGLWLAFARILRCHPLFPGGWDPVVPKGGSPPHDHAPNWHDAWASASGLLRRTRRSPPRSPPHT